MPRLLAFVMLGAVGSHVYKISGPLRIGFESVTSTTSDYNGCVSLCGNVSKHNCGEIEANRHRGGRLLIK